MDRIDWLKTIIINFNQEINCMYGVPGTTVKTKPFILENKEKGIHRPPFIKDRKSSKC